MRIDHLDKSFIESIADRARSYAYLKRKKYTPIDPERILIKLEKDSCITYDLKELKNDEQGRYSYSNTQEAGHITIDKSHYDNDSHESIHHTMGHELGHHVLGHKKYLQKQQIFVDAASFKLVKNQEKQQNYRKVEWQADYFSGALKVPKDEIKELHYNLFTDLGLLGRFENDETAIYNYLGESMTSQLLKKWSKMFVVSTFSLAVRMKYLNLLNIHGHSFIRYGKSGNIIVGF